MPCGGDQVDPQGGGESERTKVCLQARQVALVWPCGMDGESSVRNFFLTSDGRSEAIPFIFFYSGRALQTFFVVVIISLI